MKHRKLRIAWSVAWGVVAVVVCVLWVRSFRYVEVFHLPITEPYSVQLMSATGMVAVASNYTIGYDRIQAIRIPVDDWQRGSESGPGPLWGGIERQGRARALFVPSWMMVGLVALLAAWPWTRLFPRQFSLRTLLIATTLVGVALGLIAYTLRS